MPKKHRVIPIVKQPAPAAKPRVHYDCSKCPGYCCSYDLIEVGKRDIARLAKHFGLNYQQAEDRFTKYDRDAKVRTLRHQKDKFFGKACTFFAVHALELKEVVIERGRKMCGRAAGLTSPDSACVEHDDTCTPH